MLKGSRNIVHFDLDTFFVSVERLQNPALTGKPVIIGGMSDRGVVASCSYEARRFGVNSAMPMKMARMMCRDAIFIRGDMELYSRYSHTVTDIIAERSPLYEKASIDEHYIDVTGMDRFFGLLKWTHELRMAIIKNTGLPISFGLSVNKTVSKIATGEAKPNGELQVPGDRVQPFLSPLSIRKFHGRCHHRNPEPYPGGNDGTGDGKERHHPVGACQWHRYDAGQTVFGKQIREYRDHLRPGYDRHHTDEGDPGEDGGKDRL
jgi:DNA polymerase-4